MNGRKETNYEKTEATMEMDEGVEKRSIGGVKDTKEGRRTRGMNETKGTKDDECKT